MSSKNNHTKGFPSQPDSMFKPASPFIDGELFADAELAESETINSRLEPFQLESPFLSAFEKAELDYLDEFEIGETEEFEGYLEDDNIDEEPEDEEDFLEESDIEDVLDEEIEEFQDEVEYEEYGDYQDDEDVDEEEEDEFFDEKVDKNEIQEAKEVHYENDADWMDKLEEEFFYDYVNELEEESLRIEDQEEVEDLLEGIDDEDLGRQKEDFDEEGRDEYLSELITDEEELVESVAESHNDGRYRVNIEPITNEKEEVHNEEEYKELYDQELNKRKLRKAIYWNPRYAKDLKWFQHRKQIAVWLIPYGSRDTLTSEKAFAMAVARWQKSQGFKARDVDGIIGLNTWSLLEPVIDQPTVPVKPTTLDKSRWYEIVKRATGSKKLGRHPVKELLNGKQTFEHMVSAIKTATNKNHFIYILGWMLDSDFELVKGDKNTTMSQMLRVASGNKVQIKAMLWHNLNSPKTGASVKEINKLTTGTAILDKYCYSDKQTIRTIGVTKAAVNPLIAAIRSYLVIGQGFPQFKDTCKKYIHLIDGLQTVGAHHEKILIVQGNEGLIGFCGGIDINSNRLEKNYYDLQCRVEEEAALELLKRFRIRWTNHPWHRGMDKKNGSVKPVQNVYHSSKKESKSYVKILHTYNHHQPIKRHKYKERTIKNTIFKVILNARKYIYIEDQYMVDKDTAILLNKKLTDPKFKKLIILISDSKKISDLLFPNRKRREFIQVLLKSLSPMEKKKLSIFMIDTEKQPDGYVHSKLFIVDDELVIIGSANCNRRGLSHDSETAAVIFDHPGTFAKALRKNLWYDRTGDSKHKDANDPIIAAGYLASLARTPVHRQRNATGYSFYKERKGEDFDEIIL